MAEVRLVLNSSKDPGFRWMGRAGSLVVVAAVGSCTYDFDAAFSKTPAGTATATGVAGSGGATSSGSTGGSAGTGGTGGSAGSGGTGQGGSTGGENCANGLDDDGDQLNDCADPDCQAGFECAVLPGLAWSDPVGVFRGDEALTVPDCEAPFTTESDYHIGMSASAASCSSCSCDGEALCSVEGLWLYSVSGCAVQFGAYTPSALGACDPFSADDLDSAGAGDSTPLGGSCVASGGDVTNLPAIQWQENVRFCEGALPAGADGGCSDGQVCAPLPTSDFQRCVTRSGDQACAAPYTQKTLVYRNVDDQRGCTACNCSNPSDINCYQARTDFFYSNDCSGSVAESVPNIGSCEDVTLPNNFTGSVRFTTNASYDGCNPSGGQPTGSPVGIDPITVCCVPSG
ncbi:MAG: hypothetical protein JRI23_24765 [Deltaproteobacteria bacterium]|jgi:hypothetical protein|nr:hypothetical protein [Deltaproteobacteria bacterium]MBW2535216.1 hypothetical protein [Deltaproteobacteria bacterium]